MKVLFVAPELPPYAKVGGLGDVVCALSKALRNLGIDARVFCPLYGGIFPSEDWQPHLRHYTFVLVQHPVTGVSGRPTT